MMNNTNTLVTFSDCVNNYDMDEMQSEQKA